MEHINEFENAIAYFQNEGMEAYVDDSTLYLVIDKDLHVALSSSEVSYRSDIWNLWSSYSK